MQAFKGVNSEDFHFGFDSAKGLEKSANQQIKKRDRVDQSIEEEARSLALVVVAMLVTAITESTLADDELPSDRLDDLMLDATEDLDDEDGVFWSLLEASISDAFESLGVDATVVQEMFADQVEISDAAIEAAAQTALVNMPDDGEPMDLFTEEFIYGEAHEDGFDGAKPTVGAMKVRTVGGKKISYHAVAAIRNGKRTVVNKRLPNQKIRLTVKQRANLKKLKVFAQRASAIKKRVISRNKGRKMGLYK